MTIDEYVKKHNLPKMRLMGEMKNFRYYIKKDIPAKMQLGIPMVVAENKKSNSFEVCNANQALDLIVYFREVNKNG